MVSGVVLAAAAFWAVSFYSTYQREQRIAAKIKSLHGFVDVKCCGPKWLPEFSQELVPSSYRIRTVNFFSEEQGGGIPPDVLVELKILTSLQELRIWKWTISAEDEETAMIKKELPHCKVSYWLRDGY